MCAVDLALVVGSVALPVRVRLLLTVQGLAELALYLVHVRLRGVGVGRRGRLGDQLRFALLHVGLWGGLVSLGLGLGGGRFRGVTHEVKLRTSLPDSDNSFTGAPVY